MLWLLWNIFIYFLAITGTIAWIGIIWGWIEDSRINYKWLDKNGYRYPDGKFRRSATTGEFLRPIPKLELFPEDLKTFQKNINQKP